MKKLAILGASGHGRISAEIATGMGWQEIVFFDKDWPKKSRNLVWEVVGNIDMLINSLSEETHVFVGIGNNHIRRELSELLISYGAKLATLIHPTAYVSDGATIEQGSIVMPKAVVNIGSVIGRGAIINTGATVDHDCTLGEYVHISPGANLAGEVFVGEWTWVGIGACVRQGITIGKDSIVGAGSVVVQDISDNVTVVGNPAKLMST